MNKKIKCSKLNSSCCGDSCCMVMLPVEEDEIIVGNEGILLSKDSNSYLDDPRRSMFPYSKVPTHFEKKPLRFKKFYVNQILNYDSLYSIIGGCEIKKYFVRKTKEGVILASNLVQREGKQSRYVLDKEGLDNLLSFLNNDKDSFVLPGKGKVQDNIEIPTLDVAIENGFEYIDRCIDNITNSRTPVSDPFTGYYSDDKYYEITAEMDKKKELRNISDKPLSFYLPVEDFYIVRLNRENGIMVSRYQVSIYNKDKYNVTVTSIPMDSLEYKEAIDRCIENPSKIKLVSEPVFDEKINPGITKVLSKSGNNG